MADEIKVVEYHMGTVPNKVGEGARVLEGLKNAGINLLGFLGYPKSARVTELVAVVEEKTKGVAAIMKKAGVTPTSKGKGLLLTGDDRPGAVAEWVVKISAAGINIVSLHAVCAGAGRYGALIAVASLDLKKANKALCAAAPAECCGCGENH